MKPPHPHDVLVGTNLRIRRQAARMSQTTLAKHLDVTFQQVQKYERGTNRLSAGKLLTIANVLKVPIVSFYEGAKMAGQTALPIRLLVKKDAFRLAEAFDKIENQRTRNALVSLLQGLTGEDE
jgi:transcriptional regulator with XRE-family HTH domain